MKKIVALLIASMMIVSTMGIALAASATPQIHVSGLAEGDTVYSYKVLKMNTTTGAYEWNIDGMTDAELTEIVGHYDAAAGQYVNGTISEATAAKIANIVKDLPSSSTTATGSSIAIDGTAANAPYDTEAGLYCVLVTAKDVNTVYNPIFAAIDYQQTGAVEKTGVEADKATYADTAKVKKSEITVTKEATAADGDATANKVGDTITFTVTTKIPAFGANYTSPVYTISDTMSAGLEFQSFTSITVDGKTVDTSAGTAEGTQILKATNGIKTETDKSGWTLDFDPTYLLSNTTVKDVTVVYTAKVTDEALKNVNPETNKVTVEFSNDPHDLDSKKKIEDETRHYTFSIDMGLLGDNSYETSEFVKIGVDNDGNPITQEQTMSNGEKTHPLAGATFGIFTDNAGTTPYTNDNSANWNLVTGDDGKLEITGLDAGTYYLIEQSAPANYIPDKNPIEVVITPTYETVNVDPDGTAGTGDEYTYQALKSYTITVGGTTSSYTMTNTGVEKDPTTGSAGDHIKEWENRRGIELPETGGIGTTIFYVSGLVMVLGAAAILVARRKAEAE